MARKKQEATQVGDLLVELTIRKLAYRAYQRGVALRREAREHWKDKKRSAQLKFRAEQFDDLAVMIRECLEPDKTVPETNFKLGEAAEIGSTDPEDL